MKTLDYRTAEQKETHYLAVIAKGSMTPCKSCSSRAWGGVTALACGENTSIECVEQWVRKMPGRTYIGVVDLRTFQPEPWVRRLSIYAAERLVPDAVIERVDR